MPKRFDCEDEPNEFMEAPCPCDCGKWFDQEDGHRSQRKENRLICGECADTEKEEIDREEQIQEWKDQLADAEFTVKEATQELIKLGVLAPVKSEEGLWKEVIVSIVADVEYGTGIPSEKIDELKRKYSLSRK